MWSLDIDEGAIDNEFHGRFWDVRVTTVSEQKETEKSEAQRKREEKQRQQDEADDTAIVATVDRLAKESGHPIVGFTRVRDLAGVPKQGRFERSIDRVQKQGIIQEATYHYTSGKHGTSKCQARGLRRVPEKGMEGLAVQETTGRPNEQTTSLDRQSDRSATDSPSILPIGEDGLSVGQSVTSESVNTLSKAKRELDRQSKKRKTRKQPSSVPSDASFPSRMPAPEAPVDFP
jgi:hypothetical protein